MSDNNNSDYAVIISGFALTGIIALLIGLDTLFTQAKIEFAAGDTIYNALALLSVIVAAAALFKGYITEGITFVLLAALAFLPFAEFTKAYSVLTILVLMMVMTAYFSFREEAYDLVIINLLTAVSVIIGGSGVGGSILYVSVVIMVIVAIVAFYTTAAIWGDSQDADYIFAEDEGQIEDE